MTAEWNCRYDKNIFIKYLFLKERLPKRKDAMKATMAMIILAGMLFCHCAHAPQGPKWTFIGESKRGSAFYIDPETICYPAEGIVNVWVKVIPCESESIHAYLMALVEYGIIPFTEDVKETEDIAYSVILYEIDCVLGSIVSIASQDYDEQGAVLESSTCEKQLMQQFAGADTSVSAGTIWEVLSSIVCGTAGPGAICMARKRATDTSTARFLEKTCVSDWDRSGTHASISKH